MGDFVRAGVATEVSRAFEEWLHQGVQYAHDKRGNAWKVPFLSGNVYAFVFRLPVGGDRTSLLAGVLKPSQDSVGRAFPLAIYRALPEDIPGPILPLVLGEFLDSAAQLALDAPAIANHAELDTRTRALTANLGDVADAVRQLEWWRNNTGLAQAWSITFGSSNVDEPVNVLGALLEIVAPFWGKENSNTPLSIRLPLGVGGIASACFWLDLIRSSIRWRTTVPTFFWYFDGHSGDTLVQLGRTPPGSLIELWSPDARSEIVCDYTRRSQRPSDEALRRIAPHTLPLLNRHAYVAELLHALSF